MKKHYAKLTLHSNLNHLIQSLEQDEFCLYYQPIVDIYSGKVIGAEALIRWEKPDIGFLSPMEFIPVAEETGFILLLGEWILRTACEQWKKWQEDGLPSLFLSVNVSASQLYEAGFCQKVQSIIKETGIPPTALDIEITESMSIDIPHILPNVQELKNMGIHISMDDFGTGFNSLYHLQKIPCDTIKIDQSFVRNTTNNPKDATIVKTIIDMSKELNLHTIAEGVETKEQLHFLQENNCQKAQGYLFSKPLPADRFMEQFSQIEESAVQLIKKENKNNRLGKEPTRQELQDTVRKQQGMLFKFIQKDEKFIHTFCNGELLYRMNLTPDSIVGKEVFDFLPQSSAKLKSCIYKLAWEGKDKVTYEGEFNNVHYLTSFRTVKREGKVVEVIGSCVDITDRKKKEKELRKSEFQHRLMVDLSPEAILVHRDGVIQYANQASVQLLGASTIDDLIDKPILDFTPPEYVELIEKRIRDLGQPGIRVGPVEEKVIRLDGKVLEVEIRGITMNYNGNISYLMMIRDLTSQKETEEALKKSEARYRLIAENMTDLVCIIDREGRFEYASPSHVTVLGYPSDAYEGSYARQWMHEDDNRYVRRFLDEMAVSKKGKIFEYRFRNSVGEWIWLEAKATPIFEENVFKHFLFVSREITERKTYEAQLTHMAYHDYLTGLPNRRYFKEILNYSLIQAKSNRNTMAIMFLDVDNFKHLNDTLGHDIGDALLKEFSRRMKNCIRKQDTLSRYGGDEFVILLPLIHEEQEAIQVAKQIFSSLEEPFRIEQHNFFITSSVGISFYPKNGLNAENLLKNADIALYEAKESGRNNFKLFK